MHIANAIQQLLMLTFISGSIDPVEMPCLLRTCHLRSYEKMAFDGLAHP